jgi:MmyB-like transcription regulator ligand binding domain
MDFVATNRLGRALNAPLFADPRRPVNNARFVFLNEEASRQFYLDWEKGADDIVAAMRGYAGKHPYDKQLTDLIGELVTRSDAFQPSTPRPRRSDLPGVTGMAGHAAVAGPGHLDRAIQQLYGIAGVEGVQVGETGAEQAQGVAGGHDGPAGRMGGQQRGGLGLVADVIDHNQDRAALGGVGVQHRPQQLLQVLGVGGDVLARMLHPSRVSPDEISARRSRWRRNIPQARRSAEVPAVGR